MNLNIFCENEIHNFRVHSIPFERIIVTLKSSLSQSLIINHDISHPHKSIYINLEFKKAVS